MLKAKSLIRKLDSNVTVDPEFLSSVAQVLEEADPQKRTIEAKWCLDAALCSHTAYFKFERQEGAKALNGKIPVNYSGVLKIGPEADG